MKAKKDSPKQRRPGDPQRDEWVGVYSVKCVALGNPTAIWMGTDGKEHEVIGVYNSEAQARSQEHWDDLQIVGHVTRFVRPGRPALGTDRHVPEPRRF